MPEQAGYKTVGVEAATTQGLTVYQASGELEVLYNSQEDLCKDPAKQRIIQVWRTHATVQHVGLTVAFPTPDPFVRADIVFYETPAGGAVFSVGSISWFGALARNNYDNDIAQMTRNVLERFADPTPFEKPTQGGS